MRVKSLYTACLLLMLTLSAAFGITATADAQEVHALLIIIGDRDIQNGVDENRALIMNMLKQLSDDCTVKLTLMQSKDGYKGEISRITYVNQKSRGRKTTQQDDIIESQQVAKWLEDLKPKPQDTVLIYYTGHGEIDPFGTHKLIFDPGVKADTPDRAKISQQLKAKRARLRMLITDTCSSPSLDLPESAFKRLVDPRGRKRANYPSDLFLKHEGFLDITAASPRQFAIVHNEQGGHFTIALLSHGFTAAADTNNDDFLSWQETFEKTKAQTKVLYGQAEFGDKIAADLRKNRQTTQEPVAYTLPKRIGGGDSKPPQPIASTEVHALLIILGNDRYIRESIEKNQNMMVRMLKQLSNDCTVKMTLMKSESDFDGIITKTTFSNGIGGTPQTNRQDIIRSEQVAEWLANLKPKSQDTVLIYYTGHGEIGDLGTHHLIFDLIFDPVKLDGLPRKEVVKSIQRLQCRLKILITDTDSSGPSVTEPMRDVETNTSVGTVLAKQDVLRHLFLQHEGFLNLTAATEGEHALANSHFGSHFSYALISTIRAFQDTDGDNFASWGEVFGQTRQETMNIFRKAAFPPPMIRDFERLGIEGQRPKYYGQLPKRRD